MQLLFSRSCWLARLTLSNPCALLGFCFSILALCHQPSTARLTPCCCCCCCLAASLPVPGLQASHTDGLLYLTTGEYWGSEETRVPSIYWAVINPSDDICHLKREDQGMVASEEGLSLAYPVIAGTKSGGAVLAYSYSGANKLTNGNKAYPGELAFFGGTRGGRRSLCQLDTCDQHSGHPGLDWGGDPQDPTQAPYFKRCSVPGPGSLHGSLLSSLLAACFAVCTGMRTSALRRYRNRQGRLFVWV
jgi:hypothetical protein